MPTPLKLKALRAKYKWGEDGPSSLVSKRPWRVTRIRPIGSIDLWDFIKSDKENRHATVSYWGPSGSVRWVHEEDFFDDDYNKAMKLGDTFVVVEEEHRIRKIMDGIVYRIGDSIMELLYIYLRLTHQSFYETDGNSSNTVLAWRKYLEKIRCVVGRGRRETIYAITPTATEKCINTKTKTRAIFKLMPTVTKIIKRRKKK